MGVRMEMGKGYFFFFCGHFLTNLMLCVLYFTFSKNLSQGVDMIKFTVYVSDSFLKFQVHLKRRT